VTLRLTSLVRNMRRYGEAQSRHRVRGRTFPDREPLKLICCLGETPGLHLHSGSDGRRTTRMVLESDLPPSRGVVPLSAKIHAGAEDIEDLVQETYVRVYALSYTQAVDSPRALLFRIAHNMAVERARRQKSQGDRQRGGFWSG